MRLEMPNTSFLQSDDGKAEIILLNEIGNRDEGSIIYRFRCSMRSGDVDFRTATQSLTAAFAGQKSEESGKPIGSLSVTEFREYVGEYAEEFGMTFSVRTFGNDLRKTDRDIITLRDTFCRLFLRLWSSYKYTNSDRASDPNGFYPDTIEFWPYNLDKKFRATLYAAHPTIRLKR